MDENRKLNSSSDDGIGADNENLFARKRENNSATPAHPAYNQRPASPAGSQRPVNPQARVQRPASTMAGASRPVQGQQPRPSGARPAPQAGAQRPVSPNAGAQQRPIASRPVQGQSAAQRPVAQRPVNPQNPQNPQAGNSRPPQNPAARPAAAQPAPQKPVPAPAPSPYTQRRTPTGGVIIPEGGETMVAPAPVAESTAKREPVASTSVKPREKANTEKKNDKQKNAKAGADMMVGIVKAIAYMVVILVVSVFISIFVIRVGNDVFAFVKSDEAVDITIPEDATVSEIADILHENGIINFPGIFKMYAGYKKEKGPFVAGDYTITPSMSYDDLRRAFKEQVVTGTVWVTIPEGYTTDEIIDLLVENGIGKRDKYIDVINSYDFDYWFIDELEKNGISDDRAYRLDGYLFPDTYEFYKASSEETVINRLLKRFNEVFVEDYRTKAQELGYTVDEILRIASLVEKEAGGMGDFMYVSSVFHNRLKNPTYYPRMESDATTVYAIQIATGKRPDKITPEDNDFDHPYNTYIYKGLTPGPITNPSASAIRYALYPADTNYYYFITDNAGKIYFASGITEHEQNIALVRKINEQLAG